MRWAATGALVFGGLLAPAQTSPCKIQSTEFEGWAAQEVSNQWLQLIFVPELGGRLMQVTFARHAYLFVNPKFKGKYFPPSVANGKWFNYGGDKLWPMPEGKDDGQHWPGPISDELDDGEYKFSVASQGENCTVRLDGPPDPRTGLKYAREITIGADSPAIGFHAVMENASQRTIRWSMQSVTQYNTEDSHNPADFNHGFWAITPMNPHSAYLNAYEVRSGLADDPSFAIDGSLFILHWLYLENEVWLDSTAGWLAVDDVANSYAMIEKFHFDDHAEYPGKASLIFYKNGAAIQLDADGKPALRDSNPQDAPYYMEAEINSPMAELKPGEKYAMNTEWFPTRVAGRITDVTAAGVVSSPVTASLQAGELELSGSMGVFLSGKLVAMVDGGKPIDLLSVTPQVPVELKQRIKIQSLPHKVTINLIDQQGKDRGKIAEVAVQSQERTF